MFLVSLHQPTSVNSNSKHLATVRGENKHSSHLFMWVFWSNTCSFFVASLQNISVFGSFCVLLFWFFVCRMFIFYPLPQSMVNCLCWVVSLTWEWTHYDVNMNWFMYITYFHLTFCIYTSWWYIYQRQIKKVTEHSKHDKNCAFALQKRSFWTTPLEVRQVRAKWKWILYKIVLCI